MTNYKRMLYTVSALGALAGGVHTFNQGSEAEDLMRTKDTPLVRQAREIRSEIYTHSRNPLEGDLQDIANKYSAFSNLQENEKYQTEYKEYVDARKDMTKYVSISAALFSLSLLSGGLASGRVKFGRH